MSDQEIVPVSEYGKTLGKIKTEIENARNLKRSGYSIRAYVTHAPWLGQLKLFDKLVNEYNNNEKLFIIREPYGRINHGNNSLFLFHKLNFLMNFGTKLKDLESFRRDCIWNETENHMDLAKEWNRNAKLPEGKVMPEMYAAIMFDKSQVYGALDGQISEILNQNLITNEFPVRRIEQILIEKAFTNSISIMDETGLKKAIAVIGGHWGSYYKKEAELREIELFTIDCTS